MGILHPPQSSSEPVVWDWHHTAPMCLIRNWSSAAGSASESVPHHPFRSSTVVPEWNQPSPISPLPPPLPDPLAEGLLNAPDGTHGTKIHRSPAVQASN